LRRGEDVWFVCGTDDHGAAALISAQKENKPVEYLTASYNARQTGDFENLGIAFDIYGGTHKKGFAQLHSRISRKFCLNDWRMNSEYANR